MTISIQICAKDPCSYIFVYFGIRCNSIGFQFYKAYIDKRENKKGFRIYLTIGNTKHWNWSISR